jgi:hypothetical protein
MAATAWTTSSQRLGPRRDRRRAGRQIFGGAAADLIHGGAGNDEINGRGGVDQLFGDGGDDLIHWDYADLVLGTVDGGADYDVLSIVGQKTVDDFLVTSLGGSKFKVANFKAGVAAGSLTAKDFEDLRLDTRAGADRITVDYMAGSGLGSSTIVLSTGKNVVRSGTEMVANESGQLIEQDKFTISDDGAPDTVTILGYDGIDDITLSDTDDTDAATGIRVQIDGLPLIIVTDTVRSEGDTLIVSTLGGNDIIDASAVATDRAALRIIAGDGNDTLKGTRFTDVIDSGRGSDTVTGDLGLDEFFDSSPSATNGVDDDADGRIDEADENEIDTLVENLATRTETYSADVGLYNDRLVIGNLLNSAGSAPFEVGKSAGVELADAGDRWAADATVENPRTCSSRRRSTARRQQHLRGQ